MSLKKTRKMGYQKLSLQKMTEPHESSDSVSIITNDTLKKMMMNGHLLHCYSRQLLMCRRLQLQPTMRLPVGGAVTTVVDAESKGDTRARPAISGCLTLPRCATVAAVCSVGDADLPDNKHGMVGLVNK